MKINGKVACLLGMFKNNINDFYTKEKLREKRLKDRILGRFMERVSGNLIYNIRNKKGKLEVKIVISYMYGGRYCVEKLIDKGRSKVILNLTASVDEVVSIILEEEDNVKNRLVNKLQKLFK